ncbi:hypothetical protein, partial [Klebsiella pneumoniae]
GHGACVEQDDKGWDARKRAYCLKIQPATGSFARNLIYSTKPLCRQIHCLIICLRQFCFDATNHKLIFIQTKPTSYTHVAPSIMS